MAEEDFRGSYTSVMKEEIKKAGEQYKNLFSQVEEQIKQLNKTQEELLRRRGEKSRAMTDDDRKAIAGKIASIAFKSSEADKALKEIRAREKIEKGRIDRQIRDIELKIVQAKDARNAAVDEVSIRNLDERIRELLVESKKAKNARREVGEASREEKRTLRVQIEDMRSQRSALKNESKQSIKIITDEDREKIDDLLDANSQKIKEMMEQLQDEAAIYIKDWSFFQRKEYESRIKNLRQSSNAVLDTVNKVQGKMEKSLIQVADSVKSAWRDRFDKFTEKAREWYNSARLGEIAGELRDDSDYIVKNLRDLRSAFGQDFDSKKFNEIVDRGTTTLGQAFLRTFGAEDKNIQTLLGDSLNSYSDFLSDLLRTTMSKDLDFLGEVAPEIRAAEKALGVSFNDMQNIYKRSVDLKDMALIREVNNMAVAFQQSSDQYINAQEIVGAINERINDIYALSFNDSKKQKNLIKSVASIEAIQQNAANQGVDQVSGMLKDWSTMSELEIMQDERFKQYMAMTGLSAKDIRRVFEEKGSAEGTMELYTRLQDGLQKMSGGNENVLTMLAQNSGGLFANFAQIKSFLTADLPKVLENVDKAIDDHKEVKIDENGNKVEVMVRGIADAATDAGHSLAIAAENAIVSSSKGVQNALQRTIWPFADLLATFDMSWSDLVKYYMYADMAWHAAFWGAKGLMKFPILGTGLTKLGGILGGGLSRAVSGTIGKWFPSIGGWFAKFGAKTAVEETVKSTAGTGFVGWLKGLFGAGDTSAASTASSTVGTVGTAGAGGVGGAASSFTFGPIATAASLIVGSAMTLNDALGGAAKSVEWLGEEAGSSTSGKVSSTFGAAIGGTGEGVGNVLSNTAKMAALGAGLGSIIPGVGTLIGGAVGAVAGAVTGVLGGKKITRMIKGTWDFVSDSFVGLWDFGKSTLVGIWNTGAEVLSEVGEGLTKLGKKSWKAVTKFAEDTWGGITKFAEDSWDGITTFAKDLWGGTKTLVKDSWEGVKEVAESSWGAIETVVGGSLAGITNVARDTWSGITGYADSMWTGVERLAGDSWKTIETLARGSWDAITGIADGAWTGIKNIAGGAWSGIKEIAGSAWDGIGLVARGSWSVIETLAGRAWGGIKSIADGVWSGIENVAGSVWHSIEGTANGIWNGMLDGVDKLSQAGSNLLQGSGKFLEGAGKGVGAAVEGVGKGLSSVLDSVVTSVIGGGKTEIDLSSVIAGFSGDPILDRMDVILAYLKVMAENSGGKTGIVGAVYDGTKQVLSDAGGAVGAGAGWVGDQLTSAWNWIWGTSNSPETQKMMDSVSNIKPILDKLDRIGENTEGLGTSAQIQALSMALSAIRMNTASMVKQLGKVSGINLVGYEGGLSEVPDTGAAVVHEGEAILTKQQAGVLRAAPDGGIDVSSLIRQDKGTVDFRRFKGDILEGMDSVIDPIESLSLSFEKKIRDDEKSEADFIRYFKIYGIFGEALNNSDSDALFKKLMVGLFGSRGAGISGGGSVGSTGGGSFGGGSGGGAGGYNPIGFGGGGRVAEAKPVQGEDAQSKIWNFFANKGMSAAGIAGLMGNLQAESGLGAMVSQKTKGGKNKLGQTDAEYTQAIDSGNQSFLDSIGYGLAQWTTKDRKKGLLDLAQKRGTSVGDLDTQLEYLWQELNSGYKKGVLDKLMTASSVQEASNVVLHNFERPADQSARVEAFRGGKGQAIFNKFSSMGGISRGAEGGMTVPKTSDWVAIAESQKGYKEGRNNDTIFGKWFGMNNQPWCAMFVSWALAQAGLGNLKSASVSGLMEQAQAQGIYEPKGSYIPGRGDIFIMKGAGASHTGFVTGANESSFSTIEGNYSDSVKSRSVPLNNRQLTGFISLSGQGTTDASLGERLGEDTSKLENVKNYYQQGTPWVPEDQIAFLHKGEMVVPPEFNPVGMLDKAISFGKDALGIGTGGTLDSVIGLVSKAIGQVTGLDTSALASMEPTANISNPSQMSELRETAIQVSTLQGVPEVESGSGSRDVIETMKWQVSRLEAKLDQVIQAVAASGVRGVQDVRRGRGSDSLLDKVNQTYAMVKSPGLGTV